MLLILCMLLLNSCAGLKNPAASLEESAMPISEYDLLPSARSSGVKMRAMSSPSISSSAQPTDMAEDVAQETFVKAWRNLGKFRGDCTFSTWLFRIAVNCAKDAVRSAARRPASSLSFAGEEDEDGASEWDIPVTSGDTVPEDAVERRELILAVRRAVESLPEDQRQVVVMRDLHGLPYQEIADTLGIELGTVKSRLNRGRANLKTILENGNFL